MAESTQNQLIARARAANKTLIDQNLLSQEVKCPTKELIQATKQEELQVPVRIPSRDLEKQTSKTIVIEIPANKTTVEAPPPMPPPPEPAPGWLPSQEMLAELSLKVTLAIENSKLKASKMTEATRIYEAVKIEIQKVVVDWDKVTGLLKKSLDYGLPIGLEIIKIADIYYRGKVPVIPPKKEPVVIEIKQSQDSQNEQN